MKRLNRKFITGIAAMLIALMALVFGMVGCDQATGPVEFFHSPAP